MPVTAKLKYLRISPRKTRLVADLIRGKEVSEALALLDFTPKKATVPLKKLLESAIANATNNFGLQESNLFVAEIFVDEGPVLKRTRARAFGRFFPILKRTSHIEVVLDERNKREATKETVAKKATKPEEAKEKKEKRKEKKREVKKPKRSFGIDRFKPKIKEQTKRFYRRKAI